MAVIRGRKYQNSIWFARAFTQGIVCSVDPDMRVRFIPFYLIHDSNNFLLATADLIRGSPCAIPVSVLRLTNGENLFYYEGMRSFSDMKEEKWETK